MPSCLSTEVKLGRRPCRCERVGSRRMRRPETRSKEERGEAAEEGRSRARAAAAEDRATAAEEPARSSGGGGSRGERGLGGTGAASRGANTGRGAVLVAGARTCGGGAAKNRSNRGGEKEGRTTASEEKDARSSSSAARTKNSREGAHETGCRRCALQRKDKADESRSTSTMKVDDDDDGGGEACAARIVRRRRPKFEFAERGVEEDGNRFCLSQFFDAIPHYSCSDDSNMAVTLPHDNNIAHCLQLHAQERVAAEHGQYCTGRIVTTVQGTNERLLNTYVWTQGRAAAEHGSVDAGTHGSRDARTITDGQLNTDEPS
ncbi:hypothetical protein Scep_027827 [Stephania cephalantha]|uniref:Uncharacterized protein n=1 Tax=Stephania cephalantha TaxID=152367 RepID=A0AAP0EAZ9_9MAGN